VPAIDLNVTAELEQANKEHGRLAADGLVTEHHDCALHGEAPHEYQGSGRNLAGRREMNGPENKDESEFEPA
jgi:hypothetical protein